MANKSLGSTSRLAAGLALACLAASPAWATGGLACRTAGPRPIDVELVLSHTVVSSVVSARLRDSGREIAVAVAQAWLDPAELRLDLVDPNAMRHELRIRARKAGRGYDGSLWRGGIRRWVRCREA
jgi:hypothetical protein